MVTYLTAPDYGTLAWSEELPVKTLAVRMKCPFVSIDTGTQDKSTCRRALFNDTAINWASKAVAYVCGPYIFWCVALNEECDV